MSGTSSKIIRARPHLGTVVRIEVAGADHAFLTNAFNELARLEKIFNFYDPKSALSQLNHFTLNNAGISAILGVRNPELNELLTLSEEVASLSQGYFNPRREGRIDLSGIAKGYIVDKTVEWMLSHAPNSISGCVNAGGDLRFFARRPREVLLRLGTSSNAVSRRLKLCHECVATSAPYAYNDRVYYQGARRAHAAVVQARSATIADALTKVALFAPQEIVRRCCDKMSAIAMLFDNRGELVA